MSFFAPNLPWLQPGQPRAGKAPRTFSGVGFFRLSHAVASLWRRLSAARQAHTSMRRLQVIEKVHLGDKQFVALLELDGRTILASCAPGAPLQFATAQTLYPAQEAARTHDGEATAPSPKRKASQAQSLSRPAAVEFRAGLPGEPMAAILASPAGDLPPFIPAPSPLRARSRAKRKAAAEPIALGAAVLAEDADGGPARRTGTLPEVDDAGPALKSHTGEAADVQASVPAKRSRGMSLASLVQSASAQTAAPLKPGKHELGKRAAGKHEGTAAPVFLTQAIAEPAKPETKPASEPASSPVPDLRDDATFAALLQIRMLATEVFQELDTPPAPPPPPKRFGLARRLSISACFLLCCLLPHASAHAAVAHLPAMLAAVQPPGNDIHITGLGGSSAPWAIVVVLTLLSLIPSLMFCITPFARILIVFHFLRQALGLQTTPSNQTLIGLSLILTFFIMQPTGEVLYRDAILPVQAGKLTPLDGVLRAGEPMRHFMAHYVRAKDAELFLGLAHEPRPRTVEDMSFRVLLPAYILSELKAGFQIGTVLFLPFLIVDMVIASITTSVGMMQLPPVVISTPLKLLLFLMVDGWHLLIGSLMRSFN